MKVSLPALADRGLARLGAPFLATGVLSLADLHVADLLGSRAGGLDEQVGLGLAFAVRAPRHGHVGVDLAAVRQTVVTEARLVDDDHHAAVHQLPWPEDGEAWHDSVAACPLVGAMPGQAGPFVVEGRLIVPWRQARYQRRLASALLARASAPEPGAARGPLDPAVALEGLTRMFPGSTPDRQRMAACLVLLRGFTVISGGPGTGKTYTVKMILGLLRDQWMGSVGTPPSVALAAPTGKAAVRMGEALVEGLDALPMEADARAWLTGLEPSTLHRLLGYDPRNPTRFRHGAANPLPHDIVVVDEASMVDLALMCKTVEAVRPDARLILLGDRNQLASVEAGSVLADLTERALKLGLRCSPAARERLHGLDPREGSIDLDDPDAPPLADSIVHFDRPRRFEADSGIGRVAYAIASAEASQVDHAVTWLLGGSVEHPVEGKLGPYANLAVEPLGAFGRPGPAAVGSMAARWLGVLRALAEGARAGESAPEFHGRVLRELRAYRVLCANRRGACGVEGLNMAIEASLRERVEASDHPADAVIGEWMQRREEDWPGRPVLVTQNRYDVGRVNGDVGIVVPGATQGARLVAFEDDEGVSYVPFSRLPPRQTVFAMTIHKSQGSQFSRVDLVLPSRASAILTRELIYTGITRARDEVRILGDVAMLRQALGRPVQRASALSGLLWGE